MSFQKFYSSKLIWGVEHLLFMAVPISLILLNPGNSKLQLALLLGSVLYMVIISSVMGVNLLKLGITLRYFKEAAKFLSLPTLLIAMLLLTLKPVFPQIYLTNHTNLLQYVLVSVPLQEILFRSFCLWRCSISHRDHNFIIIFNSLIFAFYHLIFGNLYLVVGIFLLNLFWSRAFMKYPNLLAFILSHALIGVVYFS